MPLNPLTLKQTIKTLCVEVQAIKQGDGQTGDDFVSTVTDTFAEKLAQAITDYIKTATVTVNNNLPVTTAGTAAAQTGTAVGVSTGTIT